MIYDVDTLKSWAKCSPLERVFYKPIGRYSLTIYNLMERKCKPLRT
jgi:hypothetical protein